MLNKYQMLIFNVLAGSIGGFALIGIIDFALTVSALVKGQEIESWVLQLMIGLYVIGAIGTIATLRIGFDKFHDNLSKKTGPK